MADKKKKKKCKKKKCSNWKGKYTGTNVRIGVYRHSGKQIGIEYPDQSIDFDDFIVVSDQKTLDQLIRKNENPND